MATMQRCRACHEWLIPRYDAKKRRTTTETLAQHRARCPVLGGPHTEPRKTLQSKVAYRVKTKNGTLILCDKHLDLLRSKETAKCTGDTFAVALCDHCHPEET